MVEQSVHIDQPLKLSCIINSRKELPAFEENMLESLVQHGIATISTFIVAEKKHDIKTSFAYLFTKKLEKFRRHQLPDAFKKKKIGERFSKVAVISINDWQKDSCDLVYCSCLCSFKSITIEAQN